MMLTTLALALLVAASMPGKEKPLRQSDLPAAVRRTAAELSRGATVRGYSSEVEDGKLVYEVQLTVNGHGEDVTIAADGTVLEVEEQVALEALPAAVRDALQRKAGAGTITKVESLTKGGKLVAYEAQLRTQGKRSEVQVGPNGETLKHPE
ncbi:MAG TPA: hypothetical protein VEG08_13180 [Terriglobales bacterium]|nr:hypothetical protein [Terriglobales bacterium]